MPYTLVSFHAHPDDEALLTGGTLARAAADGHRVVLVTATHGEAGLASAELGTGADLGSRREAELLDAAAALGCARVVFLGYADSGLHGDEPGATTFVRADPQEAAERLADVLRDERADVLTIYDPAGGYGHPDHRQVHVVGRLAADRAGTPVVLEATLDRTLITRLTSLVSWIPGGLGGLSAGGFASSYTARDRITHRVDVRGQAAAKRAALQAHTSQSTGGRGPRTLGMLLRLPMPVFRLLLGREWFREAGRPAGTCDDIFATLR